MNFIKSSLVLLNLVFLTQAYYKFTNLKCTAYDQDFATIPICKLKMLQRGVVGMDLHIKLLKIPVDNVTMNLELFKRACGYHPFLYNISGDFCHFMKNGKRSFSFLQFVSEALLKNSNANHTCPYEHDIIVKRMVLKTEMFKLLPLPQGDYLLNVKIAAYNDWKALIKVYFVSLDKENRYPLENIFL